MKDKPASFSETLRATENAASDLRQHLADASADQGTRSDRADAAFRHITDNCAACHKKYRN